MKEDVKKIIEETLDTMGMKTDDAVDMIYRTGMAESGYRCLIQKGGGPALGFFQCEPNSAKDTLENYVSFRPKYKAMLENLGLDENNLEFSLVSNIALQVAFCRLHYRRIPSQLPKKGDIKAQAIYWKDHYNSALGKGTHEHFIEANKGK